MIGIHRDQQAMCLRAPTVFDWFHDHHVRLNPLLAGLRPAQYAKWCAPCLPALRALVIEAFPALLYRPPDPVADRRSSSRVARSLMCRAVAPDKTWSEQPPASASAAVVTSISQQSFNSTQLR